MTEEKPRTPSDTFIEEAEKLERRARAYRIIARMIKEDIERANPPPGEAEDLFALRCYIG